MVGLGIQGVHRHGLLGFVELLFLLHQAQHLRANRRADLQGYQTHTKLPHPRTLQQAYAQGPTVVLGRRQFLMGKVPLYES